MRHVQGYVCLIFSFFGIAGTSSVAAPNTPRLSRAHSQLRYPRSVSRTRWVCFLPDLNRCPRLRRRCHSSERLRTNANPMGRSFSVRALGREASKTSSKDFIPRCRRFRVTGDAEPPGLARKIVIVASWVYNFSIPGTGQI